MFNMYNVKTLKKYTCEAYFTFTFDKLFSSKWFIEILGQTFVKFFES